LLGAADLSHRIHREHWEHDDFVHEFLSAFLPKTQVWGESAAPYLVIAALAAEKRGRHAQAESLVLRFVESVAEINGAKGRGLPNPYHEPEPSIRIASGMDDLNPEVFAGHSYTLEPLIQFLARRLLRKHISMLWEKITRVHFATFAVEGDWEQFRWRAKRGSLVTTNPGTPQSWQGLLKESQSPAKAFPKPFRRKPEFALYFALDQGAQQRHRSGGDGIESAYS
jgi:hypothetical protein